MTNETANAIRVQEYELGKQLSDLRYDLYRIAGETNRSEPDVEWSLRSDIMGSTASEWMRNAADYLIDAAARVLDPTEIAEAYMEWKGATRNEENRLGALVYMTCVGESVRGHLAKMELAHATA